MTELLERTLPARRTRVIGRERDLDEIARRLAHGDLRLLTLTGVGGIGKTTVAVEAARAAADGGGTGAAFVDLTLARDTDDIALRCCDALGLVQLGRPPATLLVEHLIPRRMLLVLDNCEHVVGPLRPLTDRLLDRCPDLRILATSRVPLRVRGEGVMVIPPMTLPEDADDLHRLVQNPAIDLFVERAVAADPTFALDGDSARTVAAICRYVEGVPLAVELVAAQAAALTPREIEARLSRHPTAGGPSGSAADRQMDATLDWSYELLSPGAQTLLRRLAVFAGGWTVEACERVGAVEGEGGFVAGALVELVDHSLVVRGWHGNTSRYRLLTPVAEYAARRLVDPIEREAAALAHATYYLELVSRPAATFPMSESEQLDLVSAEHDNCATATRWAQEAGLVPVVTGFALSLLTYWGVRGQLHTAVRQLDAALAMIGPEPSHERGAVLGGLAAYHRLLGRHAIAEEHALAAEQVFEIVGGTVGHATAVGLRGEIATDLDDIPAAYGHYERARAILGTDADPVMWAVWHGNVGGIALRAGDRRRARQELDRAMELLDGRTTWYLVPLLVRLGRLDRLDGHAARSAGHLRAALYHARRYGARIDGILCLEELARLTLDQGDAARAATLLAVARGIRDATAVQMTPHDRRSLAADLERVRNLLSPGAFDEAWRRGLTMDLDRAVRFADGPGGRATSVAPAPRGSVLTAREQEIASLVALGLTNRSIAERLEVAPGTVRIHVERILGKLGLTSRVQIATWVVRMNG